ncbi:MAG TPA: permease prefix domain 1-containing protein [Kineosporiaceae bacterium]
MTVNSGEELAAQFAEWRAYLGSRRAVHGADVDELEDHLRDTVAELVRVGLRPDEAFLVAVKRMGNQDELAREFAQVHSERLWKQLVLTGAAQAPEPVAARSDVAVALGFAVIAALGVKMPELFGLGFDDGGDFYLRNISFFALVPLAAYLATRRRVTVRVAGVLVTAFAVGVAGANAYPMAHSSQSIVLTALHLPLALWFVVGVAYGGGEWRSHRRWMDFIRFTGEWAIYFVLIALGGGVLTGMTVGVFRAIGLDATPFVQSWLLPCGAAGAVVIAAWLVEAKQSVIENMAPVLTKVFTPLFATAMLAFLVAVLLTGSIIDVDREVLIVFDLLLVVVLGLLLYAISARDPASEPALFDRLQLALPVSAVLIDLLVLLAVASRITEWGATPNKAAALGENVVLLANLTWTAFLLTRFLRRRRPFRHLEQWQTRYLAVYAVWVWCVVLVFPPAFRFA